MYSLNLRFGRHAVAIATMAAIPGLLGAQDVSPAGVVQMHRRASAPATMSVASSMSLARDMRRGATIGGITGAVIGLAGIAAYALTDHSGDCCEQPRHHIGFSQVVTVEAIATAGGALIGAILGYGYHTNRTRAVSAMSNTSHISSSR